MAEYTFEFSSVFKNGKAKLYWTLYPDGRYFEDSDGFGGEPNNEIGATAVIDTEGRIVEKFRVTDY